MLSVQSSHDQSSGHNRELLNSIALNKLFILIILVFNLIKHALIRK